jgi:type III restriction enzyme
MYLKKFQLEVLHTIKEFFQKARENKDWIASADFQKLPSTVRGSWNWVRNTVEGINVHYNDQSRDGLGELYPRIVMKVPTGGGKTLLAVESIREYQTLFAQKRTGLVVWIVPTETIYSQTVKRLRDKGNPLRQMLDQSSGGRTIILEKGQRLTAQDIEENLVVLFVMIQSISRLKAKESLKVFQDSGGYESFFPLDGRYDLHKKLLDEFPNLDTIAGKDSIAPQIRTSLANAIRVSSAFIIIDEIHKVFSDMARRTIDGLNPQAVLGLTATPKDHEMNIIVRITGVQLKDVGMVKLDMHIIPPSGKRLNDWQSMIREIKKQQEDLEKKAIAFQRKSGIYIRPIALIQVEATGKDQRGKGRVHSLDVKEYLIQRGINGDQVALKTSSQNDIEDVDLFDSECPVRFIITKEALREGWDCSFAYILGIIPNVESDTSVTQIIGRILRQPNAQKTGIKELDESYVYYSRGKTQQMVERVKAGFKNEGLEDLAGHIGVGGGISAATNMKRVGIKKKYQKFEPSFYLPVWLMVDDGGKKRRFSYELDINANLDFSSFSLKESAVKSIQDSMSKETHRRLGRIVTLDKKSKETDWEEQFEESFEKEIDIDYLTRLYTETVENAFLARRLANQHLDILQKKISDAEIKDNFGYIASELHKRLEEEKRNAEEATFKQYINEGKLVLAVSNDDEYGYRIPTEDEIDPSVKRDSFKYYLFEDVDFAALNAYEEDVARIIDVQDNILWWFRNKDRSDWYAIQGWQKNKIRPDFVAARKGSGDKLEIVYVLESKGEHLLGNENTIYKKEVLTLMTEQHKKKKIAKAVQGELFKQVNENAEFYLVEQGKEEAEIKKLMK